MISGQLVRCFRSLVVRAQADEAALLDVEDWQPPCWLWLAAEKASLLSRRKPLCSPFLLSELRASKVWVPVVDSLVDCQAWSARGVLCAAPLPLAPDDLK